MNFLAHLWLAERTGTSMAGAILGDIVRGRDLSAYPAAIAEGIQLHRRVDAATDRHPLIVHTRQGFAEGQRRYAGIVLDLVCDHLLARDWARHSEEPLPAFAQRAALAQTQAGDCYRLAGAATPDAPRFAALLRSYAHSEGLEKALARTQARLRRSEGFAAAAQNWTQHSAALQAQLPELLEALRLQMLAGLAGEHGAGTASAET